MSDYIKSLEQRNEELQNNLSASLKENERLSYYNDLLEYNSAGKQIVILFNTIIVNGKQFSFSDHRIYFNKSDKDPSNGIAAYIVNVLGTFKDITGINISLEKVGKEYSKLVWTVAVDRYPNSNDWFISSIVSRGRWRAPLPNSIEGQPFRWEDFTNRGIHSFEVKLLQGT